MKNLSFLVLLISFSTHASPSAKSVQKLTQFLDQPGPLLNCGVEMKAPVIKKGEVKIAYDCASFPVPEKGLENEVISFYQARNEEASLEKMGLIVRSRLNKDDPTQKDVTVKFRPIDQSQKIELEKILYDSLKDKSDKEKKRAEAAGSKENLELKCESDVSFGEVKNKSVNSCSLTTITSDLTHDHQAFAQMATGLSIQKSLTEYDVVKIDSQSWKIKSVNFPKGISVERWDVKNKNGGELCILELSAKFEVPSEPKDDLPERLEVAANAAMAKLRSSHPEVRPLSKQGNKTGQALDFAHSAPTH